MSEKPQVPENNNAPNNNPQNNNPQNPAPKNPRKFSFYWVYIAVGLLLLSTYFFPSDFSKKAQWIEVKKMLADTEVAKMEVVNNNTVLVYLTKDALKKAKYKDLSKNPLNKSDDGPQFKFNIGSSEEFGKSYQEFIKENKIAEINIEHSQKTNWGRDLFSWLLPLGLMVVLFIFIMRRFSGGAGPGAQIFNIGKSKATLFEKDTKVNVTFKDVAGLDEAKVEIMEIVDFLKNPTKYTTLGGKIPKGALLIGPPGTGKTLLAKAVAGEANVPFFSLSGSDFVEMFVGVGASRVRDLFTQAKSKAPCIIFIDEIDAIGRARGRAFMQGGNDERESTLNQLLAEMDGFGGNSGIIILAATNRPDVLDSALLRRAASTGRFLSTGLT